MPRCPRLRLPHAPSPTPPWALGILSLQQSQSATAEGFELPGAQGSGQRPEGLASGLAANAIWGFSHVEPEARTSAGNPPPSALEIPAQGDSVSPTVGKEVPVFPALVRLSRRISTHTMVASGIALWESLMGKTPGKAIDPLIHAEGSMTLLLQLGSKAHVHFST